KPGEAATRFQSALNKFPDVISRFGLARSYEMRQQWPAAAAEWKQVLSARGALLQQFPGTVAVAHLQLARSCTHSGDFATAKREYQEAINAWQNGDDTQQKRDAKKELQVLNNKG